MPFQKNTNQPLFYKASLTDINEYLQDNININLYKLVKNDPDWKGLFEPLEYFNSLYYLFEVFDKNYSSYTEIEEHFNLQNFELNDHQKYLLFYGLVKVINGYYTSEIILSEAPIGHSFSFIKGLYKELDEKLFTEDEPEKKTKPNYNFDEVKNHLKSIPSIKEKIIYLLDRTTEYKQDPETVYFSEGITFDKKCDLEIKKLKELLDLEEPIKQDIEKNKLGEFTNSQIVLIFHYFYEYCKLKTVLIDKTTLARFIHLILGKDVSNITNSDYYHKLTKAPNFLKDKTLIENLELIKPLFEKVKLSEIVKMIDNELITAHKENTNK